MHERCSRRPTRSSLKASRLPICATQERCLSSFQLRDAMTANTRMAGSGFCLLDRLFGRLGLCRVSHRPGVAVRGVIGGNLQPLGGGGSLQHDVLRNLSIFSLASLSFALAARLTYRSRRRLTAVMRPLFCCFASCRITISRSASAIFCFLSCHRNIPHGQVCS